ncbi:MAG TPA: hypothetical protein VMT54_14860 [Candidatus Cybelea sp.]|nr:hypothetical protein [Candidatus Cybelea sp.]
MLVAMLMTFAAPRADATSLPNTPVQIGDTAFNFIALYPFGGQPQTQFAAINPGELKFKLDVTGVDPNLLDAYAFIEVRMDIGVQGNTQYVNIVGPVTPGTDDEGLLIGGTLSMFTKTKWAFATDGTPIALSYYAELAPGVQGTLSVNFTPAATPLPAALPLFATGFGALGLLAWKGKRKVKATAA